jgi:hypothetical protein
VFPEAALTSERAVARQPPQMALHQLVGKCEALEHFRVLRSVRLYPDLQGPPEGGRDGQADETAEYAEVLKRFDELRVLRSTMPPDGRVSRRTAPGLVDPRCRSRDSRRAG